MREVEAAVRDVLRLQPSSDESRGEESEQEGHRRSILGVLQALEIPEESPSAALWLALPSGGGLHRKAHRNALFPPRPVDREFLASWDRFQAILDFVLARFEERYLDYHRLLDDLAQKGSPSRRDAKRIKRYAPNNLVAYRYFFESISSPAWLMPLWQEGFFNYPPAMEIDGNYARPVPWPQTEYLKRMAKDEPRLAVEIILSIPATDNISVLTDLAEAACAIPASEAVRLVDKARSWTTTRYFSGFLLSEALGRLAAHLAEGGFTDEALELARALLALKAIVGGTTDPELAKYLRTRPQGLFRDWDYNEVLRLRAPVLIKTAALQGLGLFCDLLQDALVIDRGPKNEDSDAEASKDDLSFIWRADLDDDGRGSTEDIMNVLVTTVRDGSAQLVKEAPDLLGKVVETLELYPWSIFRRLLLNLLRQSAGVAPNLAFARLSNEVIAQAPETHREYFLLLQDSFQSLSEAQQNDILRIIDQGPDVSPLREDVDKEEYTREWQWHLLGAIRGHLNDTWLQRWEELKAEFGDDSSPPLAFRISSGSRPQPTVSGAEQLARMSAQEIVAFLAAFKPSRDFFGPSEEDLASELTAAVAANPDPFSQKCKELLDLVPVYAAGLLRGFRDAAEAGRPFAWGPVLDLCAHVADKALTNQAESSRHLRREIVDLLRNALLPKGIEVPFGLRETVWLVLEKMIEDPNPTLEEEGRFLRDSPSQIAINTTRGRAMETAVFYGIWVRRNLVRGNPTLDFNFELVPELRKALDRHLDPRHDPSLAVRSIYGRFLPQLDWLDPSWLRTNLQTIFLWDEAFANFRSAAWDAFVCFSQPFRLQELEILRDEYMLSVERLGQSTSEKREKPEQRLGEHLLRFYWHDRLPLTDVLIESFFSKASDEVRADALGFIGRSLREAKGDLAGDVRTRLEKLWEWRLEVSRGDRSGSHHEEMAAFGWWFGSANLDEAWALAQLETSLRISGRMDVDHQVMERLAELAPKNPKATSSCVESMIDGAKEQWQIHHWSSQIRTVISAALRSGDDNTQASAKALINRLAARGFLDFGDLLIGF
jgi:hypothetical protein